MTDLLVKIFIKRKPNPSREDYGRLAGIVGIICNLILSAIKFIIGTLSNSVSIIADATNNISDAGTSIVTLVGFKLSGKPADEEHPYGHARIEYITGLIISFLIIHIGLDILLDAINKIITPEKASLSVLSTIILGISVLFKLWLGLFNKKLGKTIKSKALEATAADCRNDVIATSMVLVAAIISGFTGFNLDGYIGVIVAALIIYSGIGLAKDTVGPLLGQPPSKELYEKIESKILSYENVLGVHDLLIHSYGPEKFFASAHIEMDANTDVLVCHDIMDTIERDVMSEMNIHLVVHLDPTVLDCEETNDLKALVADILREIDPIITFHDFRVVVGDKAKNVLFDIVVPPSYKYSDKELKDMISEKIKVAGEGNLYAVILVDKSYGQLKSETE